MRLKLALVCNLMLAIPMLAGTEPKVITNGVAPSLRFTENLGQWNGNVLFRSQLAGGQLYVENTCLTFSFYDQKKLRSLHTGGMARGEYKDFGIKGHAYKVHFENANLHPRVEKQQKNADYENFYLGKDPAKWKSGVNNFGQVLLRDLYPGIDYELLASGKTVKYNFHVKPQSDPGKISLRYEGVEDIRLQKGALVIRTSVNEITENKPYAYQVVNGKITEVTCNYRFSNSRLTFEFPNGYDRSVELVIDPLLVFSAQAGSLADNFGMTATFDQNGNLYSGGVVYDSGYPIVLGSFDPSFNSSVAYGNTDVFITKYSSAGNALIFSTYLGGSSTEVVSSLIVDKNNNLCLYGATGSANFPTVSSSAFPLYNGGDNIGFISNGCIFPNGSDIFITKFNSTGSALIGSTFYGGSYNDGINYLAGTFVTFINNQPVNTCGYDSLLTNYGDQFRGEIQLDSLGNIYICSSTRSTDIPILGGFDNTLGGAQDAVVAMFSPNLNALQYSTYLGGSNNDCGNGIFITPNFETYATGGTSSTNFPGTTGGHGPVYKGGKCDGFISRIASNGTLSQSTYIGTNSYDNSFFVQCDKYGSVYVFGQSLGSFTVQAFQNLPLFTNSGTHQFLAEFNLALTTLQMSTVFGSKLNGLDISPSAFAVDECNGNLYLSGWGGGLITNTVAMNNMPILNPTQNATTGYDFYLMALKPHASTLLYGSYFGGVFSREHVDGGTSRFDRKGIIYQSICAGCGGNQDYPISPGSWPCPNQSNCPNANVSGNCNNGVLKINFDLQKPTSTINTNTTSGCTPLTLTLTNANPGTSFKWYFGNGQTNTVTQNPVVTYNNPGTFTVSLLVRDTTLCIKEDSTIIIITVQPGPSANMLATPAPCTNSVSLSYTSAVSSNVWDYGDGSTSNSFQPVHTYTADGIYNISLTAITPQGCKTTLTQTVSVLNFVPAAAGDGTLCRGSGFQLQSYGGTQYQWSPPEGLNNANIQNPIASPASNIVYSVNVINTSFGQNCSKTFTMSLQVMPTPTTEFAHTVHPCGGMVFFSDQSLAEIVAWNWDFGASGTSTVSNPVHFFPTSGSQKVILVTTNIYGCKSTKEKAIDVITAPVSVTGPTNICKGESAQLKATGGLEYEWLPDNTLSDAFIADPVATPPVTTNYSVIITTAKVNSVTGAPCEYTLTSLVKVSVLSPFSPVTAYATPSVILRGETALLVYTGDPGAIVSWLPTGSTNPGFGYTVSASPRAPTVYTAHVVREACRATVTVEVDVRSELCEAGEIFIPNTFTPNGDGQNDVFHVRGISVDEMYFAVYNRWGEMMFETKDKVQGWDGRYEGRDAEVGVFGWYLKVKCYNGEETFKKGNVTLIR
jgi:gliding motility-associated-like protein